MINITIKTGQQIYWDLEHGMKGEAERTYMDAASASKYIAELRAKLEQREGELKEMCGLIWQGDDVEPDIGKQLKAVLMARELLKELEANK